MLLTGTHNQKANLQLHAFESGSYADILEPGEDWLKIKLDIITAKESWHVIDPSLTAADVMALADWLYKLAGHNPVCSELAFLEPTLSFHLISSRFDNCTIKIVFYNELKPAWHREREYSIICRLNAEQLKRLATGLLYELMGLYMKTGSEEIRW